MLNIPKILAQHRYQTIPDIAAPTLPEIYRGVPVLNSKASSAERTQLVELCPTGSINAEPFTLNLGRCVFCGECAIACPSAVRFTNDYRMATNTAEHLVIHAGDKQKIAIDAATVRAEIHQFFGGSLKLREVSAGGNNGDELELNACNNVNFDMGRYGIDFVASPRHADGVVITGPITRNMARALEIAYDGIPDPRIIILAGTEAISGGIFADSPALDRSFVARYPIDLYVPGNPVHPLTFVNGVLDLIRAKR